MPTKNTRTAVKQVLDYVLTYNTTCLPSTASDMILNIDSDAAYLVLPKDRSPIAACFSLLSKNQTTNTNNKAVLIECHALKHVVTSEAEAEI